MITIELQPAVLGHQSAIAFQPSRIQHQGNDQPAESQHDHQGQHSHCAYPDIETAGPAAIAGHHDKVIFAAPKPLQIAHEFSQWEKWVSTIKGALPHHLTDQLLIPLRNDDFDNALQVILGVVGDFDNAR